MKNKILEWWNALKKWWLGEDTAHHWRYISYALAFIVAVLILVLVFR